MRKLGPKNLVLDPPSRLGCAQYTMAQEAPQYGAFARSKQCQNDSQGIGCPVEDARLARRHERLMELVEGRERESYQQGEDKTRTESLPRQEREKRELGDVKDLVGAREERGRAAGPELHMREAGDERGIENEKHEPSRAP